MKCGECKHGIPHKHPILTRWDSIVCDVPCPEAVPGWALTEDFFDNEDPYRESQPFSPNAEADGCPFAEPK